MAENFEAENKQLLTPVEDDEKIETRLVEAVSKVVRCHVSLPYRG